jgi:hypothetical protein
VTLHAIGFLRPFSGSFARPIDLHPGTSLAPPDSGTSWRRAMAIDTRPGIDWKAWILTFAVLLIVFWTLIYLGQ